MKIKKIISLALAFCLIGGTAQYVDFRDTVPSAYASDYTEGTYGDLTFKNYGDYIEISDCDASASGSLTIPSEIDGLPVTSIGNKAFYYCSSLDSITIPDSVTDVGGGVFCDCTNLKTVKLSNNMTSLGTYGNWTGFFRNCKSLTSITIPDSVTSIGDRAFSGCSSLTSITIPDSVTSIGEYAFSSCTSLTSITIPYGVTEICDFTFYNSAIKTITLSNSVTSIGEGAFSWCSSLASIIIENPDCEIYDIEYTISDTAAIYGYTGSTAQTYAEKYDRTFVALDAITYGDVNSDSVVDAIDASLVLSEYARNATGADSQFNAAAKTAADVNTDGIIDAIDASLILGYYAYTATGGTGSIADYLSL